ncbi:hypothetical protein EYC98_16660 [Halieaceae bacterium IMCC14734]|uniref:Uncharacterized protein n=1 Tax=Candidatus Litorirhabdus singularis TaxID=2518993 RepID=A0ABT3TJJ9_9GAMM|nr:hypothetical protein [Candidatus Litorirhabdus singularis]MCX2982495.1 hypothetical protein [Candidatus Litorirhabdus singularis]
MDPNIKLRRHAKLWESGTANVQRWAVGSVIFAVVMMLNVIKPYHENYQSQEVKDLRIEFQALEDEQKKNGLRIAGLNAVENVLDEIRRDIKKEPWADEIKTLVDHCRGGCPADTKPVANGVINAISLELRELIVDKLDAAINTAKLDPDTSKELKQHAKEIREKIEEWRQSKINTIWYRTRAMKRDTGSQAGNAVLVSAEEAETKLSDLGQATLEAIKGTTAAMESKKQELDTENVALSIDLKDKNETIEKAMNRALPGWATGLFTVEDMIKNYPWILISLIVFMLANAWNAGRHFRGMADAEGWSIEERSDPLLSSPWTLTWRGYTGSAVTTLYYFTVLGALAACLFFSLRLSNTP